MAYAASRLGYHHPQAEGKRTTYFDHDDQAVLDPAVLDGADIMQSPNSLSFRRDSFVPNIGVLSPADSHSWEPQYPPGLAVESTSAGAANHYHEDGNLFVRQAAPQGHAPGYSNPHGPQWAFDQGSGNCTPTTDAAFMHAPPPFDGQDYAQPVVNGAHPNFGHPSAPQQIFNGPPMEANYMIAPQVQTPMSPHSHQDWMSMAQQEMECRPIPKRMRPNSPPTSTADYQRRDGIRKKNGRIEIPQERNVHTIDELIEEARDEDIIKELKQQRRLLRNREAALASRQRKKKHTEDLEVKEKGYAQQMTALESELQDLARDCDRREQERQMLIHRFQESQRVIEDLQEQMRTLKVQHHEETSSLRRKVNVLSEQLEAGPAPAMSAAPSSTGFTDFNAEMEALNMGAHEWDNFIFIDELRNESPQDLDFGSRPGSVQHSPVLAKRPSSNTIVPDPPIESTGSAGETPIASGLLFMLLLFGAFVASKPANLQPKNMPKMPPDVRAAAPAVLSNLLAEVGGSMDGSQGRRSYQVMSEPTPSGLSYHNTRSTNRLDRIHQRLTAPTKQQEIDQAFALTPAQYASITNADYQDMPQSETLPGPRRNLAEALASMQQQHQQTSKADVYTRSLLWEKIPTEVVKQFKEMVRDFDEIEARTGKQPAQNEVNGFKIET